MRIPTEIITSKSNALVSLTASLKESKYREREGLFRFDGVKLLREALACALPLAAVLVRASGADAILSGVEALPADCRLALLSDGVFDRLSEEKSPEGVICVSRRLDKLHKIITINRKEEFTAALSGGRMLFLESVRDPGNLGTAVRSARAFGVDTLVLSADCADIYHPRTLRAAMGTLFSQRVLIADDLPAAVAARRAFGRVFAAALDENAARLGTFTPKPNDAAVIGNEGHGLSPAVKAACTGSLYIPMSPGVESLNAGVAASVILWEFARGGNADA